MSVRGLRTYSPDLRCIKNLSAHASNLCDSFEDMNRALAAHQIKPAVDNVFGLDEAVAAYRRLESQNHIGKVVIRVGGNTVLNQ